MSRCTTRYRGNLRVIGSPFVKPSSLARPTDQFFDWSRKSRLKVQQLGLKRCNFNTSHLLVQRAHLRLKRIPLVGSDAFSARREIFGWYAVNYVDGGSTSHEQNMGRESVGINGKRYLWICFQCRHFGCVWRVAQYKAQTQHRSSGSQSGSRAEIRRVPHTLIAPEYLTALAHAPTDRLALGRHPVAAS